MAEAWAKSRFASSVRRSASVAWGWALGWAPASWPRSRGRRRPSQPPWHKYRTEWCTAL